MPLIWFLSALLPAAAKVAAAAAPAAAAIGPTAAGGALAAAPTGMALLGTGAGMAGSAAGGASLLSAGGAMAAAPTGMALLGTGAGQAGAHMAGAAASGGGSAMASKIFEEVGSMGGGGGGSSASQPVPSAPSFQGVGGLPQPSPGPTGPPPALNLGSVAPDPVDQSSPFRSPVDIVGRDAAPGLPTDPDLGGGTAGGRPLQATGGPAAAEMAPRAGTGVSGLGPPEEFAPSAPMSPTNLDDFRSGLPAGITQGPLTRQQLIEENTKSPRGRRVNRSLAGEPEAEEPENKGGFFSLNPDRPTALSVLADIFALKSGRTPPSLTRAMGGPARAAALRKSNLDEATAGFDFTKKLIGQARGVPLEQQQEALEGLSEFAEVNIGGLAGQVSGRIIRAEQRSTGVIGESFDEWARLNPEWGALARTDRDAALKLVDDPFLDDLQFRRDKDRAPVIRDSIQKGFDWKKKFDPAESAEIEKAGGFKNAGQFNDWNESLPRGIGKNNIQLPKEYVDSAVRNEGDYRDLLGDGLSEDKEKSRAEEAGKIEARGGVVTDVEARTIRKEQRAAARAKADPVKAEKRELAEIRMRIGEGKDPTPAERKQLDEAAKSDPINALIRAATSGGTPRQRLAGLREEFDSDPNVEGAQLVEAETDEEKKMESEGYPVWEDEEGVRGYYTGRDE